MTVNFIKTQLLNNIAICDQLINYHKSSKNQFPGYSYDSTSNLNNVNTSIKDSTDVLIDKNHVLEELYIKELSVVIEKYIEQYSYCSWSTSWGLLESIAIQQYAPGGGYKEWHCERASGKFPVSARHLVFMTYLNDVTDQGETEFWYQELKIKPVKGLTVIWPADWTHTHRGIPSPSQEKFIVTGWLSFVEEAQTHPIII